MLVKRSTQSTIRVVGRHEASANEVGARKTAFWSLMCGYLIESFALYAASIHPVALFPVESLPDRRDTPQSGQSFGAGRRGLLTLVSTTPSPQPSSPRPDPKTAAATPAGSVTGFAGNKPHEREIAKAVAALAEFDDLTLRELGIPDRSQIERTVRYCHDC
jgi:hypothetical protein